MWALSSDNLLRELHFLKSCVLKGLKTEANTLNIQLM